MEKSANELFYSGLSGLQLPLPKYLFPETFQNTSRLTYYASLFNSIEINSSFYKIPLKSTVVKWAASVPDNFKFTFKLWKEITHCFKLNFNETDVLTFLNVINSAGTKKGCLLIQLPPGLDNVNIPNLERLLRLINQHNNNNWEIAVEFRNQAWYQDVTYNLLEFFHTALVVHDIPKSATPKINHSSDFIYIRFHGPTGNYRDSYTEDFLLEYATHISEWMYEGKTVYVYFNNTVGDAFNNATTLNKVLQRNIA